MNHKPMTNGTLTDKGDCPTHASVLPFGGDSLSRRLNGTHVLRSTRACPLEGVRYAPRK